MGVDSHHHLFHGDAALLGLEGLGNTPKRLAAPDRAVGRGQSVAVMNGRGRRLDGNRGWRGRGRRGNDWRGRLRDNRWRGRLRHGRRCSHETLGAEECAEFVHGDVRRRSHSQEQIQIWLIDAPLCGQMNVRLAVFLYQLQMDAIQYRGTAQTGLLELLRRRDGNRQAVDILPGDVSERDVGIQRLAKRRMNLELTEPEGIRGGRRKTQYDRRRQGYLFEHEVSQSFPLARHCCSESICRPNGRVPVPDPARSTSPGAPTAGARSAVRDSRGSATRRSEYYSVPHPYGRYPTRPID